MLRKMHEQSQGKLLCLVLLKIHSVFQGALDVEQRLGMYYAKVHGIAPIFLAVVAVAGLSEPIDAIHRGPSFPKVAAFEVTPPCVEAAMESETSEGRPATDVMATWRLRPTPAHDTSGTQWIPKGP